MFVFFFLQVVVVVICLYACDRAHMCMCMCVVSTVHIDVGKFLVHICMFSVLDKSFALAGNDWTWRFLLPIRLNARSFTRNMYVLTLVFAHTASHRPMRPLFRVNVNAGRSVCDVHMANPKSTLNHLWA